MASARGESTTERTHAKKLKRKEVQARKLNACGSQHVQVCRENSGAQDSAMLVHGVEDGKRERFARRGVDRWAPKTEQHPIKNAPILGRGERRRERRRAWARRRCRWSAEGDKARRTDDGRTGHISRG